ncbi:MULTISPECIES: hypothetical protein [unclassified Ruegeria]|nr:MULTISPECIES: hypothetical protein [unclassified Ruegeria]MBO9411658.1 hypothetical protein [Ruegeria sp. R8_1]MBO9415780.1 hypothetical protein [Ruegeria sp. R8_2]
MLFPCPDGDPTPVGQHRTDPFRTGRYADFAEACPGLQFAGIPETLR